MKVPVIRCLRLLPLVLFGLATAQPLLAGEADVVGVKVTKGGPGVYHFETTVRHADTGWKHYADGYEVLAPNGKVLGTRVLAHPHIDEQPFTRSLRNVVIPGGIENVRLRAHDKVHGHGGAEIEVELPR